MSLDAMAMTKTSTRLLDDFKAAHVFEQFTNKDYEGEIKYLAALKIFTAPIPDVAAYVRDTTTIAYQRLMPHEQALIIDQRDYWGIKSDDLEKQLAVAGGAMWQRTIRNGAWKLADTADAWLSALMAAGVASANVLAARTVGGSLNASAYELVVDMAVTLRDNNVPAADWHIGVPPKFLGALKKDQRFTGWNTPGAERRMRSAGIGEPIEGLQVHESTECPLTGSTYTLIAASTEATTFAVQLSDVENVPRDKDDFDDRVRSQLVFGGKVTQPQGIVTCAVQIAS